MSVVMKQIFASIFLLSFFISCTNDENTTAAVEKKDEQPKNSADTLLISGCYLKVYERDSIYLDIHNRDSIISGTVAFKNYQKDSSHGTVEGKVQDGKLILWYDFFSEGMQSVMQLAFKPTPDGMIRGTGELLNKGDTVYFRNIDSLQFAEKDKLIRVKCNPASATR